uniref:Uncharacterized protein n=1 Tax=Myoviridae sp. ctkfK18 TaxID=2825165 RepID=A0A8S5VGZ8_9CAUD|nr:MAG TPA: hypothetical protein [Myoviridae sp. ctkfK18]
MTSIVICGLFHEKCKLYGKVFTNSTTDLLINHV